MTLAHTESSTPDLTGALLRPVRTSRYARRRRLTVVVGIVLLLLAVLASLAIGSREIEPGTVWQALIDHQVGHHGQDVVIDQRLPRTLLGVLVGACLAAAGTVMQGITRNPLADPGLLGVNAGASLLVVLAITFLGITRPTSFIWFALGGAAIATVVVYLVGSLARDGATPVTLALAGTAVTAGVTSVISLLLLSHTAAVNTFRFWSVGSLAGRDGPGHLATTWALAPFLLAGLVLAVVPTRQLNLVAMGSELARGLGVRLGLARAVCAAAVILLAGTATALAGPIVFVGLVIPHLVRMLVGPDYRWILAVALLYGPTLLVTADVIGRVLVPRDELEAGLVVAAVGAPAMIAIIRRIRLVQV